MTVSLYYEWFELPYTVLRMLAFFSPENEAYWACSERGLCTSCIPAGTRGEELLLRPV